MAVQSQIVRRVSLDHLPNELLFQIVSYCGDQKAFPRRYRILYTLSQLSRRFRTFALLVLAEEISAATCDQFTAAVSSLEANGRVGYVRRVRIGHSTEPSPYIDTLPVLWCMRRSGSLRALRSFSCWQGILTNAHLLLLEGSLHLTDLSVVLYEDAMPVDFGRWHQLRTLRVEFCAKTAPFGCAVTFPSYVNLTTLAVNDAVGSEWLDAHLRHAHFPSLRVLNLQYATSPPWLVYQFIHRHPTLLEVNVGFDPNLDHWLAFDRLLKLIHGTGTWGPESGTPGSMHDDPIFTMRGIPALDQETYCVSTRFAFSRVPLYPEATQWDKPEGSQRQRYIATGLALSIVDQCFWEDNGTDVVRLHQFLARMPGVFPELAELRLAYGTPYIEGSFQEVMQSCAASLTNWTSLRKLTFSWGTSDDDEGEEPFPDLFRWRPDASYSEEETTDILDEVQPPIHVQREYFDSGESGSLAIWPRTGQPYTAQQLETLFHLSLGDVEAMQEAIRAVCDPGIDDDTLMDTPGLPLKAWVARHEPLMLKMMRQLAVSCPTLETIAWHPVRQAIWCSPVRWLWKVHREKESQALRMLSNEFTYQNCPQGDPPALHILVGHELTVAEEHPAMVHRK